MVLVLSLIAHVPGCGPEDPEVHKDALYAQESLARELAFRYRSLNPDAKKVFAQIEVPKEQRPGGARDETTKKKGGISAHDDQDPIGTTTVDDLLADITNKLKLIKEMPPNRRLPEDDRYDF